MREELQLTFRGERTPAGTRVTLGGNDLSPCTFAAYGEPYTFAWGPPPADASQLAFAMMQPVARNDRVLLACYLDFAVGILAAIHADTWEMSAADVYQWLLDWTRRNHYSDAPPAEYR